MNEEKTDIEILEGEGWTRQFVANEPRLSEAVEMYGAVGFEVHLEPLPKGPECKTCVGGEDEGDCRICFEGVEEQYRIIFTRPKKGETESEEDLF